MFPSTPSGLATSISLAVKTALLALMTFDAIPLTDAQVGAVSLAVAAVADVLLYLGILKPKPEAPAEDGYEAEAAAPEDIPTA